MTKPNKTAKGTLKPRADIIPLTDETIVCPEPVITPFRQKVAGTIS